MYVKTLKRAVTPACAVIQHVMPWGRAVKPADAVPLESVTALVANPPLSKKPHASLAKTTVSPAAGRPSASKKRTE